MMYKKLNTHGTTNRYIVTSLRFHSTFQMEFCASCKDFTANSPVEKIAIDLASSRTVLVILCLCCRYKEIHSISFRNEWIQNCSYWFRRCASFVNRMLLNVYSGVGKSALTVRFIQGNFVEKVSFTLMKHILIPIDVDLCLVWSYNWR
jgi:hypothetical protein